MVAILNATTASRAFPLVDDTSVLDPVKRVQERTSKVQHSVSSTQALGWLVACKPARNKASTSVASSPSDDAGAVPAPVPATALRHASTRTTPCRYAARRSACRCCSLPQVAAKRLSAAGAVQREWARGRTMHSATAPTLPATFAAIVAAPPSNVRSDGSLLLPVPLALAIVMEPEASQDSASARLARSLASASTHRRAARGGTARSMMTPTGSARLRDAGERAVRSSSRHMARARRALLWGRKTPLAFSAFVVEASFAQHPSMELSILRASAGFRASSVRLASRRAGMVAPCRSHPGSPSQ
jgi:hypothetical protein